MTVVVLFCEGALGQGMCLPWRTPSWTLLPGSHKRFPSALLGPRHSRWETPSFPRSGRQPGWLCMRRWWSRWRTTRHHQRCGQTGTCRPKGRGVRSTDINCRRLWGRAKGQPKPCQQSCQTLLHPSPRSARCENSYVREILLGILFLITDKDLCGCYSSGVIKPYRHIFITLSHIHTHQYTCQQRQICQHLSTKWHTCTNILLNAVTYTANVCAHIYEYKRIYIHDVHMWSCSEMFPDCLLIIVLLVIKGHQNNGLEGREGRMDWRQNENNCTLVTLRECHFWG